MNPLVLTIDLGTQSLRAVLVDRNGTILHMARKKFEHPYFSPEPGWAEQDADFYWEQLCEACQELKSISGEHWERVRAVSLTTIRDSVLCVDKEGVPLHPVILWLDRREAALGEPLPRKSSLLYQAARMKKQVELIRKVSSCNWLRHHRPDIWEKTHKFVMLSTYLSYKLCGNMADSTASIVGHVPYDNKAGRWLKPGELNYCLFPVEESRLCDLVLPGEVLGDITEQASRETGVRKGLPLIATGSDKGCETLGLSCTTPEKAAISFGTTATVQYTTPHYVEPQRFFPPYQAAYKGRYNPEIEIYRGYWLISWFKKEFAAKEVQQAKSLGVSAEDLLNHRLQEVPPGCEGLVFQPYFTPGVSMLNARGSVIGFSDVHTRIHIYRAIIEGINFALMEGMHSIERQMKKKTEAIYLAGGGSRSSEICQITADMFGLPVHRTQTHEAAAIGSSLIAFTSLGVFSNLEEGIHSMVHIRDVFYPTLHHHELYQKLYHQIYTKVFKKLQPLYSATKHLEANHGS